MCADSLLIPSDPNQMPARSFEKRHKYCSPVALRVVALQQSSLEARVRHDREETNSQSVARTC